jgi:glutaminase
VRACEGASSRQHDLGASRCALWRQRLADGEETTLESHDGDAYSAGDAAVEFTIQSISKPFVLALAVEELGLDAILGRVGCEPSGEPFNAISLEPGTGRPDNPLAPATFDTLAEALDWCR